VPGGFAVSETADAPRPFDAKTVEYLVGLMSAHDLSEISLNDGKHRIRLKRGVALATAAAPVYAPAPAAPPRAAEPAKLSKAYHEIKSPMVGTFYSKPAPDKPDYVQAGSRVTGDTVVCKLEAMKIFNDLPAECAGTVVEVCVKNGQPVDFGTVLFRVDAV
jgi:acetyl-CoA carboxylase biotin carboxyl carrier protein